MENKKTSDLCKYSNLCPIYELDDTYCEKHYEPDACPQHLLYEGLLEIDNTVRILKEEFRSRRPDLLSELEKEIEEE